MICQNRRAFHYLLDDATCNTLSLQGTSFSEVVKYLISGFARKTKPTPAVVAERINTDRALLLPIIQMLKIKDRKKTIATMFMTKRS